MGFQYAFMVCSRDTLMVASCCCLGVSLAPSLASIVRSWRFMRFYVAFAGFHGAFVEFYGLSGCFHGTLSGVSVLS